MSIKMTDSVKVPWMVTPIEFLGIEAEITGSAYLPSKVTFSSSALQDGVMKSDFPGGNNNVRFIECRFR